MYNGSVNLTRAAELLRKYNGNKAAVARAMNIPIATLKGALNSGQINNLDNLVIKGHDDSQIITCKSKTINTLEDAVRETNIDTDKWEIERWMVNKWDSVAGCDVTDDDTKLGATELWQVKIWLKAKNPKTQALEKLLEDIKNNKLILPKPKYTRNKKKQRRELEISIADPHLGLVCSAPGAGADWDLDKCEQITLSMVTELIESAKFYAPYEQIILPIGNDFLHADNIFNTTTAGTLQPDAAEWHNVFVRGEQLAFSIIEYLASHAPVKVIIVPGNHDRHSTFTMGRVINARYHNCKYVTVECDSSPYKFHKFGVNLIGFEHGHSVKPATLPALMANETRTNGWADARYCEWHLGDQHRKGTAKPSSFEEQGVSVEYLPGLTPPNDWHKLKGYNWQKRAGMAFVWDYNKGPIARLQVNIDNYTGTFME